MSDCFVLYLLLTCMKKKTSGADKFTNNNKIPTYYSMSIKKMTGKRMRKICTKSKADF